MAVIGGGKSSWAEKRFFAVFELPQMWTPICPFFLRKNIFAARLVFEPSRTAKKAAKRTRAGFRSCSSALATLIPLSTPDRAAGSEVPGSAGALVRFGAHSPPTRRRSCFMPRGTIPRPTRPPTQRCSLLRGLYPACCPSEPAWGIPYLFPSRWFRVNQATETRAVRVLGGMKGLAPGQGPGCRAGL